MRDQRVTRKSARQSVWAGRPAVEVPDDPFVFLWTVSQSGYEWLDGVDGKRRLFPRHTPGLGIRRYAPEPGLFREFAALDPTRDAIRDFAGKYGDLFDRWDIEHTLVRRGRLVGGTSLDRWKIKIRNMRELVEIWDQIQEKRVPELRKIIVRSEEEICYVRDGTNITLARKGEWRRFAPRDVLLPAMCALQLEIYKRLSDTETPTLVVPRLTLTPDTHPWIVFQPCNLLAAMRMQFAQATTGAYRLQQCAGCDKYFPVGPGAKRGHSITCSAKCRKRKERADEEPKKRRARKSLR